MYFIVPDICNQNGCFILVTLQWFKYSANPEGSTLYTEKSQTSKMFETHFYRLYSIMTGSKSSLVLPLKMAPNFEAVLSVLLQFVVKFARVCHICVFLLKKLSHYKEK